MVEAPACELGLSGFESRPSPFDSQGCIMNTKKLFDVYARCLWPIHRKFVRCLSKRCKKCIISELEEELVDGVCLSCRTDEGVREEEPGVDYNVVASFEREISYAVSDKQYDVSLMLSGGKDSAYILHRLRTDFPDLKIVCILVNNGFMSPVALENANQAAAVCDADLIVVNSFVPEFKRILRQAFLDLNGTGGYGIIDFADGSTVYRAGEEITRAMNIPILLGGLSWFQVEHILGVKDYKQIKDEGHMHMFPLYAWRVPEQEIRKYVVDNGLIPHGQDSPIVSNSDLILAMGVIDILNLGYSSFEKEFAAMVRTGTADRKFWLRLFELLEYGTKKGYLNRDVKKILSKLDLVIDDIVKK